jgi:hypothetical protein
MKKFFLTEEEKNKIRSLYEQSTPINESSNWECLYKAGFTRESVGGPMTKHIVLKKQYNSITYQIDLDKNGTPTQKLVIIKGKLGDTQECSSWTCDSGSPIGIKFQGCKTKSIQPM